jgi:hypothetical protein
MSGGETWVISRKTRESANKEGHCLELFGPGPLPLKEKAKPRKISANTQHKLKGREREEGQSKMSVDLFCLAHKDNGAVIRGPCQKGWPHSEVGDGAKAEKKVLPCAGIARVFCFLEQQHRVITLIKRKFAF